MPTLDGYVTLEVTADGHPATAVIYDAVGRAVWRQTLATATSSASAPARHVLDLRELAVGTYILRLTTDRGTATRRVVRD